VEALVRLIFVLALALGAQPQQQLPKLPQLPIQTGVPEIPVQGPYEFTSDIGVFVIVVRADKAPAFEAAMAKLKTAFAASAATVARKQQASGWRVLKSTETPTPSTPAIPAVAATATTPAVAAVPAGPGLITYIFLIDPVSKKASYDPIEILRELLPDDVQSVYDQLKDSWVSATRIGLTELMRMGVAGR
jgi:hypothetical protein